MITRAQSHAGDAQAPDGRRGRGGQGGLGGEGSRSPRPVSGSICSQGAPVAVGVLNDPADGGVEVAGGSQGLRGSVWASAGDFGRTGLTDTKSRLPQAPRDRADDVPLVACVEGTPPPENLRTVRDVFRELPVPLLLRGNGITSSVGRGPTQELASRAPLKPCDHLVRHADCEVRRAVTRARSSAVRGRLLDPPSPPCEGG